MTSSVQLPTRPLGRIPYQATMFALGGEGVLRTWGKEAEARAVIQRALDIGVNYFDSAPAYAGSLDYYGASLGERRAGIFLASKTADRSRDGSLAGLDTTLRRLRTDYLDLWQLHDVRTTSELHQIFAPGGAVEALVEARQEGRVRHLGITGHYDPMVLAEALERFPFDTVLIPLNCADVHRLSFARIVLPIAQQKGMAVIAMKVFSGGLLGQPGSGCSAAEALNYALSLPGVACAIIGCRTIEEVEANAEAVRGSRSLATGRAVELEALHSEQRWTPYKRATDFDVQLG